MHLENNHKIVIDPTMVEKVLSPKITPLYNLNPFLNYPPLFTLFLFLSVKLSLSIYIYIYVHTHTHTYIYMYIYIYIYI